MMMTTVPQTTIPTKKGHQTMTMGQHSRQVLLYAMMGGPIVLLERCPTKVWALLPRDVPLPLPIRTTPWENAAPLKRGKDWHWQGGRFRYNGSMIGDNIWLLLEYD